MCWRYHERPRASCGGPLRLRMVVVNPLVPRRILSGLLQRAA